MPGQACRHQSIWPGQPASDRVLRLAMRPPFVDITLLCCSGKTVETMLAVAQTAIQA
jgi:hypothetical protein